MTAAEIIRAGSARPARPWPRYAISSQAWQQMASALATSPELRFEALWAGAEEVFALFTRPGPLLVAAPVEAGVYAALSPARPEAAPFERAVGDLWGHLAADAADPRPWLDHGFWPVLRPMLVQPVPNAGAPEPVEPRPAPAGAAPMRLGPLQPHGPALLQVAARAETVVQIEARLGYAHRGLLALMRGRTPAEAAPLVARVGSSTVAHSLAFASAVEAALGAEPPPRAIALRGVAAEIERIALHLHDFATCLEAAGHDPAPLIDQREAVLAASGLAFGHRLLMGLVVPGGVARDIAPEGAAALGGAIRGLVLPRLGAGLQRRSAASFVLLTTRLHALRKAADGLLARLAALPDGPFQSTLPLAEGEALGRAEGARGVVWHWLRVREGRVAEAFARDPAWLLWPQFERDGAGAALADLPVLAGALGLSAAGADL